LGGAKKRSISQIAKQQKARGQKGQKSKKKKGFIEKKTGGLDYPEVGEKTFDEIAKMGAITPFTIASKYGLKLSIAKNLLKELEKTGKIQYVAGSSRIKVYKYIGN